MNQRDTPVTFQFPDTKPVSERDLEKYGKDFLDKARKIEYVNRITYYVPYITWKSRVIKASNPEKLFELYVFVKKHHESLEIERKFGI